MEKERKIAISILEEFEDLLESKGFIVPSRDRKGEDTEAFLFGDEYYRLEDRIVEILKEAK